jgi:hypothetical protein
LPVIRAQSRKYSEGSQCQLKERSERERDPACPE